MPILPVTMKFFQKIRFQMRNGCNSLGDDNVHGSRNHEDSISSAMEAPGGVRSSSCMLLNLSVSWILQCNRDANSSTASEIREIVVVPEWEFFMDFLSSHFRANWLTPNAGCESTWSPLKRSSLTARFLLRTEGRSRAGASATWRLPTFLSKH